MDISTLKTRLIKAFKKINDDSLISKLEALLRKELQLENDVSKENSAEFGLKKKRMRWEKT